MKKEDWISAKDRLPEKDGHYLVAYPRVHISYFHVTPDHKGDANKWIDDGVTYWMPLPDPPKLI